MAATAPSAGGRGRSASSSLAGTPNLRELLVEARRQGCQVIHPNRTGEIRVVSPHGRVNVNGRRKDGCRALIVLLRKGRAP